MIKAVILDMDGLIIDSEPIHSKAFEAILKEYGHEAEYDEFGMVQVAGLKTKASWMQLLEKYPIVEDLEILVDKKRKYYWEILKLEIKPMPGLLDLIRLAKDKELKTAIASNSNLKMIELVLDELRIKSEFDIIISGDFVEKAKPHPEIYLTAAKELEIDPKDCLALEDSAIGVTAASAAGMKVIAVPTSVTRTEDFSKALLIVSSLEDINWDILSEV